MFSHELQLIILYSQLRNRRAWEPNYSPSLRALTQQKFPSHSNVWVRPPSFLSCTIWYFRLFTSALELQSKKQGEKQKRDHQERAHHCLYTVWQTKFLLIVSLAKINSWPHCWSTRGWKKQGGQAIIMTQYSFKEKANVTTLRALNWHKLWHYL